MKPPGLGRSITLRFQGDWGMANFHRACGWLSEEMGERCGFYSRFIIQNGRGGFDAALAVHRGVVDVSLTTPASFIKMALEGKGHYDGEEITDLRAIGVLPQWDRLVFAIDLKFGIGSFAELRARRPALKIAVSRDDGSNHIGFATRRIMEAETIPEEVFLGWGGQYLEFERPDQCIAAVRRGEADAVFQEAIMTKNWRELLASRSLNLISLSEPALRQLNNAYGWDAGELPAGYFDGLAQAVTALEYSDFLILVRSDMPDDVAQLLGWCFIETRGRFEGLYHHIPRDRSPVTYPLDPKKMVSAPIPLHPGAEAYYRAAGLL